VCRTPLPVSRDRRRAGPRNQIGPGPGRPVAGSPQGFTTHKTTIDRIVKECAAVRYDTCGRSDPTPKGSSHSGRHLRVASLFASGKKYPSRRNDPGQEPTPGIYEESVVGLHKGGAGIESSDGVVDIIADGHADAASV
jgi:hypothetical protein